MLAAMLRKAQRSLARKDVATYIEYVTGQEPAPHHHQMLDFALDIIDNKKSGVILAPRGSGKTTILNTGLLPWLIALRPNIRIGLLSQKDKKAEAMSSAIMSIISESEEFIEVFGNLRGDHKWTASEWIRKDSDLFKTKDRTMITGGADQSSSAVSKRFDLIFCHEKGTPILHDDQWIAVEDHPTAQVVTRSGLEIAVWGLPYAEVVTPEHRYWAQEPDGKPGWIEAWRMERGAFIGYPIDYTVERPQGIRRYRGSAGFVIEDQPEFEDADWWWLLGLWWGDGHRARRMVGFTLSDQAISDRLTGILDRYGYPWNRAERDGCWQITFQSTRWAEWLTSWRSGNSMKQPPAWVERIDLDFQAALLRGYVDADGFVDGGQREIRITSVHLPGLLAARRMFARLGIPASIRLGPGPSETVIAGRVVHGRQKFDLRFHNRYAPTIGLAGSDPTRWSDAKNRLFIEDGFLWSKVRGIAEVDDREFVPIQTESHEYLTAFGRSHNCDDILDENNTYNIDRREKLATWFWKTLKPAQAAEGTAILVVGTRWVEDDLYQQLIEGNKWPSLVIPAITVDPVTEEEVSYWPKVWPLERLYAEREDVGWDNFACSYLNDISGLRDGTIFRKEWWKDNYFTELPHDREYVFTIGIDLASSERERADWTTGVVTAQDDRHEHWVLYHTRIKTDSGHRAFVRGVYNWAIDNGYPVSRILIENNQHQSTLVQDLLRETNLPVVGRRADVDKRTRARAAAARYESHRVHHHERLRGRELETEMLGFPKGHDDLVDALGLSMDLTMGSGSTAGVGAPLRDSTGPTAGVLQAGSEVIFRDGPRTVPAHLVAMLAGLDTETKTYDEAIQAMNANRLNDYIRGVTGGILRGR